MQTIQTSREPGLEDGQGNLALMLRAYARSAGLTYEQLAEAADVPVDTLLNWTKGRVRRPRNWRDIAQVARALHLTAGEADALLRQAGHISLERLTQIHPHDELLRGWAGYAPARVREYAVLAYTEMPTRPLRVEIQSVSQARPKAEATPCPHRRQRTKRLAALVLLVGGMLPMLVSGALALNPNADLTVGGWSMVGPVQLSPVSIAPDGRIYVMVGQWVTATLHLHNDTNQNNLMPQLGLGGRGPDGCEKNWGGQDANFPGIGPVAVPAGGTFVYQTSSVFTTPGVYFAEPVWGNGHGHGGGITPFPRVWFTVTADRNNLPPRDCLTPIATPFTLGTLSSLYNVSMIP